MAIDNTRSMEVKVGGLILAAATLLVIFLLLLGDVRCGDRIYLFADFPNSGDLKAGAPVKISGVTVGKVASVELLGGAARAGDAKAAVVVRTTLHINAEPAAMLRQDARFYISSLGVLGEKYVEIDPGSPGADHLAADSIVQGVSPLRLEVVGADATSILSEIQGILTENRENLRDSITGIRKMVASADDVIAENRESLKEAVENLNRLSAALATATGDGSELRELVVSLRDTARKLDRGLSPTLDRLPGVADRFSNVLDNGTILIAEMTALVAAGKVDLAAILANIRMLTQAIRDGKGTIGGLLAERELYDDLIAFMKDVKRHPWKLLIKN
jgi:phospholipid/cholesterol/gamma-HCH transport system substrate-binding protein